MAEEKSQPLAYVHETVLKKGKNNEEWAVKRREQLEARKKRQRTRNSPSKGPMSLSKTLYRNFFFLCFAFRLIIDEDLENDAMHHPYARI